MLEDAMEIRSVGKGGTSKEITHKFNAEADAEDLNESSGQRLTGDLFHSAPERGQRQEWAGKKSTWSETKLWI